MVDNSERCADTQRLSTLLRKEAEQGSLIGLSSLYLQQSGENIGYGRANNLAQHRVLHPAQPPRQNKTSPAPDYVLILNPDVDLDIDALSNAFEFMAGHPDCVLLTPRSVDATGRDLFLNHAHPSILALLGRAISPLESIGPVGRAVDRYELRKHPVDQGHDNTVCASGCFMLFRQSAFAQSGGFEPAYFLYFEDYDLSMRIRQIGAVNYVPAVSLTHLGGGAAWKGFKHRVMFITSAFRFFQRHGWRWA